ncbi:hypothetical protein POUND7_005732 [Theobroma cacao]
MTGWVSGHPWIGISATCHLYSVLFFMLREFTQPPYKNLSLAIIIIIGGVEPWPAKSPVGHCVWSQNMTCSSANLVSNHKSAQKDSFISSQSVACGHPKVVQCSVDLSGWAKKIFCVLLCTEILFCSRQDCFE